MEITDQEIAAKVVIIRDAILKGGNVAPPPEVEAAVTALADLVGMLLIDIHTIARRG